MKYICSFIVWFSMASVAVAQSNLVQVGTPIAMQQSSGVPLYDTIVLRMHLESAFPKVIPELVMEKRQYITVERVGNEEESYFVPIVDANNAIIGYQPYIIREGERVLAYKGKYFYSTTTGAHLTRKDMVKQWTKQQDNIVRRAPKAQRVKDPNAPNTFSVLLPLVMQTADTYLRSRNMAGFQPAGGYFSPNAGGPFNSSGGRYF